MSRPPTNDWVGRLRYAVGRSAASRQRLSLLWLVVAISLVLFVLYITGLGQQPDHGLRALGMAVLQLAIIGMAVGDSLYSRARLLSGLFLIMSFFVLFPLAIVFTAAHFFSQGTTFGLLVALLFLIVLLAGPGRILYRYLSMRGDETRRG